MDEPAGGGGPKALEGPGAPPFLPWEILPAVALLLGVLVQVSNLDPRSWDLGWAYKGGVEAWRSGRPELVRSWMSTSFLGMTMALVARFLSERAAVRLLNLLNFLLVGATLFVVWRQLRGRVPRAFFWASLTLTAFFGPLLSTIFYKQFNIIAFCLVLSGFRAFQKNRDLLGSALVALSICLKPLAFFLPVALLFRKDSRRAGVLSLVFVGLFMALAQVFLAVRADDVWVLDPLPTVANFSLKGQRWIYAQENFSPRGMFCRLATERQESWQTRGAVGLALLAFILVLNRALSNFPGRSWEFFAACCALSIMVGPIAWAHYQVFLLPLFLLLAFRFQEEGASHSFWAMLLLAYFLADLLVRPLDDSLFGGVVWLATGRRETFVDLMAVMAVSQFGQYILVGTALAWFRRRGGAH